MCIEEQQITRANKKKWVRNFYYIKIRFKVKSQPDEWDEETQKLKTKKPKQKKTAGLETDTVSLGTPLLESREEAEHHDECHVDMQNLTKIRVSDVHTLRNLIFFTATFATGAALLEAGDEGVFQGLLQTETLGRVILHHLLYQVKQLQVALILRYHVVLKGTKWSLECKAIFNVLLC